jgi:hypothetical protein
MGKSYGNGFKTDTTGVNGKKLWEWLFLEVILPMLLSCV